MKEQLHHTFLLTVLGLAAVNPLQSLAATSEQNNAQRLQALSQSQEVISALEKSNLNALKLKRSQQAKLRTTWRSQVKQGKGPLINATLENETSHWLKSQTSKQHFDGMILSNAYGYSVAQTLLTPSIRPRFVTNALKQKLVGPKVTRSYTEPYSKKKVTRIMVPVKQDNKTIGILTAMVSHKK